MIGYITGLVIDFQATALVLLNLFVMESLFFLTFAANLKLIE